MGWQRRRRACRRWKQPGGRPWEQPAAFQAKRIEGQYLVNVNINELMSRLRASRDNRARERRKGISHCKIKDRVSICFHHSEFNMGAFGSLHARGSHGTRRRAVRLVDRAHPRCRTNRFSKQCSARPGRNARICSFSRARPVLAENRERGFPPEPGTEMAGARRGTGKNRREGFAHRHRIFTAVFRGCRVGAKSKSSIFPPLRAPPPSDFNMAVASSTAGYERKVEEATKAAVVAAVMRDAKLALSSQPEPPAVVSISQP